MKQSLILSLLAFACVSCSSLHVGSAPAQGSGIRKVAAVTGGHGTQVASAASAVAASESVEQVVKTSVFPPDDPKMDTLPGKHRKVSAATAGHGSTAASAASAQAENPTVPLSRRKKAE